MTKRRVTPERDIQRLAERIWQRGRGKIRNKDDYNAVFNAYLTSNGQRLTSKQRELLRDKTFQTTLKQHSEVSNKSGVDNSARKEVFQYAARSPSKEEFSIVGKSGKRTVYLRRTKIIFKTGCDVTLACFSCC